MNMFEETKPNTDQIRRLADFCQEDGDARKLNSWLSNLKEHPKSGCTRIRELESALNISHRKAISIFKRLEKIDIGFITPGRHGYATRLTWKCSLLELAKELWKELEERETRELSDEEGAKSQNTATPRQDQLEHSYVLRPDFVVRVRLPLDITKNETERLANWARTLAFD
jgi:hypothetical protein